MRYAVIFAVVTVSAAAGASPQDPPPKSNPAFLGINMWDPPMGPQAIGPCGISKLVDGGAAQAAGLLPGDSILAVDGVATDHCADVSVQITAHQPGDSVEVDVLRNGKRVAISAKLSSRAEILDTRFASRPLDGIATTALDDGSVQQLSELRGTTTILAWFDVNCADCTWLIRRVTARAKHLRVASLTKGIAKDLKHLQINTGTPIGLVDDAVFSAATISELDRVTFMVIDCKGIVRFVSPIAPEADDSDAALDELLAAAEQADHAARSHR